MHKKSYPTKPCIKCKRPRNKYSKTGLCLACFHKSIPRGEKHFNWKKSSEVKVKRYINSKGKVAYRYTAKCKKCNKEREVTGKKNPAKLCSFCSKWKGGISKVRSNCIDCGEKTSTATAKRCVKCHNKYFVGKRHHSWRENSPHRNRRNYMSKAGYNQWRTSVFKRDSYTCQKCGKKGGKLCAHHLYSYAKYPQFRLMTWNGATLCKKCHNRFHQKYTTRNNNREQFERYLTT